MDDAVEEGWQTVLPTSHHGIERLPRSQLEAYERQILREWETSRGHWSGIGKHTSATDFTEAKKLHPRFRPAAVDKVLGSGTYGVVEKVTYTHNNRSISLARKWIQYRRGRTIHMLREEANVMEKLDHEHIVKLVGTYSVRHNELYILLWPVATCNLDSLFNDLDSLRTGHGDRDDVLKRLAALDLRDLPSQDHGRHQDGQSKLSAPGRLNCPLRYLQQIVGCTTRAVAVCHEANIRHLDLKPSNILLSPGRVYLADFGIARDVNDRDHTMTFGVQGTPKWRAPEVCDPNDEWSMKAADIYSLGMVLLNIATIMYGGDMADFDHVVDELNARSRAEKLKQHIVKLEAMALATQDLQDAKANTFAPKHIVELTSRMLATNPSSRPTARQVDADLVELGGIEQIYHFPCCKRSSRFVTDRIDMRYKAAIDDRDRLLSLHNKMAQRLEVLERKDETYEARLKNERKAHADNIAHLQEQLDKERKERARLEALLAGRRIRPGLPRPERSGGTERPGLTMRTRPHPQPSPQPSTSTTSSHSWSSVVNRGNQPSTPATCTVQPTSYSQAAGSISVSPSTARHPEPTARKEAEPAIRTVVAIATGLPSPSQSPGCNPSGFPLRSRNSGSRLPRAVNPSTPIRCNTPNLQQRDSSMTDSTQFSMASSTFSRLSGQSRDSESAIGSPAVGRTTPAKESLAMESRTRPRLIVSERPSKDSGVGLGLHLGKSSNGAEEDETRIKDAQRWTSASIRGPPSPVLTGSALSSPRAVKAELEPRVAVGKIPPLPTAKSWADVARRERT